MMIYRKGAVGALLDEYEKAILELQHVITDVSDQELITVVDYETKEENCRSFQSVLSHVVRAVYSYAIYINSLTGEQLQRPEPLYFTIGEYARDLNKAFAFTTEVLKNIPDGDLEQFDPAQKIATSWGQLYDIEQMMEHAIVHILRHRRQLQRFKNSLRIAEA